MNAASKRTTHKAQQNFRNKYKSEMKNKNYVKYRYNLRGGFSQLNHQQNISASSDFVYFFRGQNIPNISI